MTFPRETLAPVAPLLSVGDVQARRETRCKHGRVSYCATCAKRGERAMVEAIHEAAHEWAVVREYRWPEEFAAWCVWDAWRPGSVRNVLNLPKDWARYLRSTGRREPRREGICNR